MASVVQRYYQKGLAPLFSSISGTDGQRIPRSSTQHAGVTGPTRPKGSVLLANVGTSPVRHPVDTISGWSTYYGLSNGVHQGTDRVFKPPSQGAFVGSRIYGIFRLLPLGGAMSSNSEPGSQQLP